MSAENESVGMVQVVMLDEVFDGFRGWLESRGLEVGRTQFDLDDLPTYTVGLKRRPVIPDDAAPDAV